MKTLKWNGERWCTDERSLWKRFRQWMIWIGGWEKPNGKGWKFRNPYDNRIIMKPWPVSLFGHRFTFFGDWFQVKPKSAWWILTVSLQSRCHLGRQVCVYVSANGTPPRKDNPTTRGFFIIKGRYE